MEKKLVEKMIMNCFKQYYEGDSIPLSDKDLEELTNKILQANESALDDDLYAVVNDAVYDFLTK
ncbi:YqzH family protein [Neobacillus mesonae]|uniref:YqzH family protein n=1 Tax=Neobacillus mesonae TaxID=1193713 RepID=UPI0025726042|nr:YqzH family protein [Neobacillus mesonae]